ncbi:MAG TPA: PH domain-containing protein [Novosphingobium sp.]|nr:PH domain-containing protein [Novosphingobium sp.]
MDTPEDLIPLDPAYAKMLRVRACLHGAILLALALVGEVFAPTPTGLIAVPALALAAWLIGVVPQRRYARWGYAFGADRLRVVSGYLFYNDTVVPLGRIQHIDLDQGPLMRRWDLAELTVHTAGSHGASVSLPGLRRADAEAMREAIREHIRKALD